MERVAAGDEGTRIAFIAGVGGVVSLLATLAAFVLYLRTLAPTVLYYDYPVMRDAPALQVKAYLLGIPDVTGYPTYAMLTHLLTYLPFGDPAYWTNLASAIFGTVLPLQESQQLLAKLLIQTVSTQSSDRTARATESMILVLSALRTYRAMIRFYRCSICSWRAIHRGLSSA